MVCFCGHMDDEHGEAVGGGVRLGAPCGVCGTDAAPGDVCGGFDPAARRAAMLERGVLVAFNSGTYLATVRLAASLPGTVANVPVSRGIAAAAMVVGSRVAVAVFDPAQPVDAMVVGVF